MTKYFFILVCFSFFSLAHSNAESGKEPGVLSEGERIYSEYLSKVTNAESEKKIDLKIIKTAYSVWVFFQENCQSCKKMFKELKCIPKSQVTPLAVGIMSEPKVLLREARSHSYKGPVYYSKDLIERRLDLEVTPTVFLFKGQKLISRDDNFISCADLKSKLL